MAAVLKLECAVWEGERLGILGVGCRIPQGIELCLVVTKQRPLLRRPKGARD